MFKRAERPRVATLLAALAVIAAIIVAGGGVLLGRSSMGDRPTGAELTRATSAANAARHQLATLKSDLAALNQDSVARIIELKTAVRTARGRQKRAAANRNAWRKRARRAERRLR